MRQAEARRQTGHDRRRSNRRLTPWGLPGGVDGEGEFPHRFSIDEMALDDLFEHFRRAGVIPDPVGIDHRNGTASADAQAIDFAPINQRGRTRQIELLQARLEELPSHQRLLTRGTVRLRLVGAQKNMPGVFLQAQRAGRFLKVVFCHRPGPDG